MSRLNLWGISLDVTVSSSTLNFAIGLPTLFSSAQTLLLANFDPMQTGQTLTDDTGLLALGDIVQINSGTYEMVGSGFAQPGVELLGIIVPLGAPVDLILLRNVSTGELTFVYPDGTPSLLGAVALVVDVAPEPYNLNSMAPVCFSEGTLIETPHGEVRIEDLRPDDVVISDRGELPILWMDQSEYEDPPAKWRPVLIRKNALGPGQPHSDLRVSPQHRLPLPLRPGCAPQLGPAVGFTGCRGISKPKTSGGVRYHHILLEFHAMIRANGAWAETLLLGPMLLESMKPSVKRGLSGALGCSVDAFHQHSSAVPWGACLSARQTREALASLMETGLSMTN